MFDFEFAHPERIHLIWVALALLGLMAWLELHGRDVFARFLSTTMQARLARQLSPGRRIARLVFAGLTLLFAIGALMGPYDTRNEAVATRTVTADVMVVFDVSRSMLATDAAPTRLERARADVRDMLEEFGGNRVGLVAFAGRASVVCPLTTDFGFFRLVLDGLGPKSVDRGGTRIGDALRKAAESFSEESKSSRVVVLITDGEDHDSYPLEAAKALQDEGIPVVAIGFGDEAGSNIEIEDPDTGARSLLTDRDGNVVNSKLDGETLRSIALATNGIYVPAGTAVLDLHDIVGAHIRPLMSEGDTESFREMRRELHQWFVLGAMIALLSFGLVGAGVQTAQRRVATQGV